MPISLRKKEKIGTVAVVGGGIAGRLTAIDLAQTGLYDVHLYMEGPSSETVAPTVHTGFEYITSPETGKQILRANLRFMMQFPDLYTDTITPDHRARFVISAKSEKHGKDGPDYATAQQFAQTMRKEYEILTDDYARQCRKPPAQMQEELLGTPEEFVRFLSRQDVLGRNGIKHAEEEVIGGGGLETSCRCWNAPKLEAFLSQEMDALGVHVHKTRVTDFKTDAGMKKVVTQNGEESPTFNEIVLAAAHNNVALAQKIKHDHTPIEGWVDLHSTVLLELPPGYDWPKHHFTLTLRGDDKINPDQAGMFAPVAWPKDGKPGLAFLYFASGADLGDGKTGSRWIHAPLVNGQIPREIDDYIINGRPNSREAGEDMVKALLPTYPFLKYARVIGTKERPVIRLSNTVHERLHKGPETVDDGVFAIYGQKLTTSSDTAMEATQKVLEHSLQQGRLSQEDYEQLSPIGLNGFKLPTILKYYNYSDVDLQESYLQQALETIKAREDIAFPEHMIHTSYREPQKATPAR